MSTPTRSNRLGLASQQQLRYVQMFTNLEGFIGESSRFNKLWKFLEKLTRIKRIYLAQVLVGLLFLYMIFGQFAQLICNIVGFAYPAYQSFIALMTRNGTEAKQWLTYWVIFAFFTLFDFFSGWLITWFPFFWLTKCYFLVWCSLPGNPTGSQIIYENFIRKYFKVKVRVKRLSPVSRQSEGT